MALFVFVLDVRKEDRGIFAVCHGPEPEEVYAALLADCHQLSKWYEFTSEGWDCSSCNWWDDLTGPSYRTRLQGHRSCRLVPWHQWCGVL